MPVTGIFSDNYDYDIDLFAVLGISEQSQGFENNKVRLEVHPASIF